jgi:hypothetical protein
MIDQAAADGLFRHIPFSRITEPDVPTYMQQKTTAALGRAFAERQQQIIALGQAFLTEKANMEALLLEQRAETQQAIQAGEAVKKTYQQKFTELKQKAKKLQAKYRSTTLESFEAAVDIMQVGGRAKSFLKKIRETAQALVYATEADLVRIADDLSRVAFHPFAARPSRRKAVSKTPYWQQRQQQQQEPEQHDSSSDSEHEGSSTNSDSSSSSSNGTGTHGANGPGSNGPGTNGPGTNGTGTQQQPRQLISPAARTRRKYTKYGKDILNQAAALVLRLAKAKKVSKFEMLRSWLANSNLKERGFTATELVRAMGWKDKQQAKRILTAKRRAADRGEWVFIRDLAGLSYKQVLVILLPN